MRPLKRENIQSLKTLILFNCKCMDGNGKKMFLENLLVSFL
jgi:hypothetical protein